MSIDEASTGLGSAAPRSVTPYSVSIPHTFGMATTSAYLRPGPTLLHETVGTIRPVQPVAGRLHERFQDPSRVNLRKATRAAVGVPAVFALFVVTGNTPSALFAAFGSFSALVF